jgi:outer membrane lipoprotein-sorting protein
MNTVLRYGITAIFLVFSFCSFVTAEAKAQDVIGRILRTMDAHNKALSSLKADVTMVKHNPQLNVSDTYVGSTSYLPGTAKQKRYMRLDWVKPQSEQISLIGEEYELYKPSIKQVYWGKVDKAKNSASVGGALAFMNMSKDQLRTNYNVVYIGEEQISGGVKTWHLQLTPKTAASYKLADLWVDGDGMPRQAKITERNDDTTTVLLSNPRKNETIKTSIFTLSYDKKKVSRIRA